MQFLGRLKIKSKRKIITFLNSEHVGRISSIDMGGYPQIVPMNFVYDGKFVYMHSHVKGEKLNNIRLNNKVGFEVDKELEYLPSYFEDEFDASLADTLYISVIIKGQAKIINYRDEKILALNLLMEKYQPEGKYKKIESKMKVIDHVAIIKILPLTITGKYKIGQHLSATKRLELAKKILEHNSPTSKKTLEIMGVSVNSGDIKIINELNW